jgi:hypothetical protein
MTEILSAYGFKLHDIVINKVELEDEYEEKISPGTKLRIVAIAAKVRKIKIVNSLYFDYKDYFFNAVREDQDTDYGHRIRADFCTIKKF